MNDAFQSEFEDSVRVAILEAALGLQPPIVVYTGKVTPTTVLADGTRGVYVPHKCSQHCIDEWLAWEAYRYSARGRAARALVASYELALRVWRAL